jgi:hypothetical protein
VRSRRSCQTPTPSSSVAPLVPRRQRTGQEFLLHRVPLSTCRRGEERLLEGGQLGVEHLGVSNVKEVERPLIAPLLSLPYPPHPASRRPTPSPSLAPREASLEAGPACPTRVTSLADSRCQAPRSSRPALDRLVLPRTNLTKLDLSLLSSCHHTPPSTSLSCARHRCRLLAGSASTCPG